MDELLTSSLTDLTAALRERRASPVELMTAVLARIDAVNPSLNALVARIDRAVLIGEARAAEQRILRGEARPLEGIPLGVKDLEDAAGLPTTHGSVAFKDQVAQRDSTQVARLKAAGAIVVGKTHAPELGSTAYTKTRLFGVCRNPWNLEMSPGGSSGGSAAALASHMLPLVTGSDGGGSVRIPACFVGAFGLKPSYGRIPNGPRARWHWITTEHNGPITKTVADAALFLDQVAGACPYDEHSLPHPGHRYADKLKEPPPQRLRIAFSPDFGEAVVQHEVAVAVRDAVAVLERLGHRVQPLPKPPPHTAAGWVYLNNLDNYARLAPLLAEHGQELGRGLLAGIMEVKDATPDKLELMIRRRAQLYAWAAELFAEHDLLVTPTVAYDGHPAAGPYPREIDGKPAHATGPGTFTIPWNLAHNPAATVRVGISSRSLPIGMQIVGARHRDELVLQVAAALERELPAHPHWPKL
jgi:Asp-tRNA(Asn)/Glu-tRNA(Gln) amidotransferase A subunit family amidase